MIPVKVSPSVSVSGYGQRSLTRVVTEQCISKTTESAGREEQSLSPDGIASTDFLWSQLPLQPATFDRRGRIVGVQDFGVALCCDRGLTTSGIVSHIDDWGWILVRVTARLSMKMLMVPYDALWSSSESYITFVMVMISPWAGNWLRGKTRGLSFVVAMSGRDLLESEPPGHFHDNVEKLEYPGGPRNSTQEEVAIDAGGCWSG